VQYLKDMESVLRKVGVAPAFSGVDSGLKAEPAEPTRARDRVATGWSTARNAGCFALRIPWQEAMLNVAVIGPLIKS